MRQYLTDKGYAPQYGARPVARTLQTEIEDRVTDLILEGTLKEGDIVVFSMKDGGLVAKKENKSPQKYNSRSNKKLNLQENQ